MPSYNEARKRMAAPEITDANNAAAQAGQIAAQTSAENEALVGKNAALQGYLRNIEAKTANDQYNMVMRAEQAKQAELHNRIAGTAGVTEFPLGMSQDDYINNVIRPNVGGHPGSPEDLQEQYEQELSSNGGNEEAASTAIMQYMAALNPS